MASCILKIPRLPSFLIENQRSHEITNMDSCGPTNALSSLLKHAQRDNSLQHEFRGHQPQQHSGFKQNQAVDNRLNNEFASFSRNDFALSFMGSNPIFQNKNNQSIQNNQNQHSGQFQNQHSGQFQNQFSGQFQNQHSGQFQNQHSGQFHHPQNASQQGQQSWVKDFSAMSIQSNQVNQPLTRPQGYQPMLGMLQMSGYQPQMYQTMQAPPTEHQEVHKMEQEQKLYEDQFEQLEKELQGEGQQVEQNVELQVNDSREKEEFARMAEKVKGSLLTSELSGEKIQNSNFLKLMHSISNREVELEGDKLVETTGTRTEPELSQNVLNQQDAVRNALNQQDTVRNVVNQQNLPGYQGVLGTQPEVRESEQMRPHLPDPLAHLKDGDLSGISDPLLAAKVVSGNQVQTGDWMDDDSWLDMTQPRTRMPSRPKNNIMSDAWQEVYDDYKNDDDIH